MNRVSRQMNVIITPPRSRLNGRARYAKLAYIKKSTIRLLRKLDVIMKLLRNVVCKVYRAVRTSNLLKRHPR